MVCRAQVLCRVGIVKSFYSAMKIIAKLVGERVNQLVSYFVFDQTLSTSAVTYQARSSLRRPAFSIQLMRDPNKIDERVNLPHTPAARCGRLAVSDWSALGGRNSDPDRGDTDWTSLEGDKGMTR
jgi:hypothetical protein